MYHIYGKNIGILCYYDTNDLINNNLNLETILDQFKGLIVKVQDQQASYCKFIKITLPNNLTKPGFPDITDLDDKMFEKREQF